MTRLIEDWIKDIPATMKEAEGDLVFKTGLDFIGLAAAAAGISREKIMSAAKVKKVGVIPITTGLGVIGSFSESVAAIVRHMKFEAFVTEKTDVAGIYEAHQKGAEILFMADDERFLAVNTAENKVGENSIGTAKGYIAALEGAVGSLNRKKILVLGCGRVGRAALHLLKAKGADCTGYIFNQKKLQELQGEGWNIISDPKEIVHYPLLFDANIGDGWLANDMLHPEVWIAAPGVPLSLDALAFQTHKNRLIHDYLPIGVAAMLADVL